MFDSATKHPLHCRILHCVKLIQGIICMDFKDDSSHFTVLFTNGLAEYLLCFLIISNNV